jgi:hypothetical protein
MSLTTTAPQTERETGHGPFSAKPSADGDPRIRVAALRAQFNRAFAPSPSSGRPISELTSAGVNGGILKWKAKRNEHRAIEEKQRNTPSWPVPANAMSPASCSEDLQSDMLGWPRIWNGGRLSRTHLLRLSPNRRGAGRHLGRGAFSRMRRTRSALNGRLGNSDLPRPN